MEAKKVVHGCEISPSDANKNNRERQFTVETKFSFGFLARDCNTVGNNQEHAIPQVRYATFLWVVRYLAMLVQNVLRCDLHDRASI